MYHIYIDVNKREIVVKDIKFRTLKKYTNISTKNTNGVLRAIKLTIFSLNKVFKMNVRYNDFGYIFYINDKDLIRYIKTSDERFNIKIKHYWNLDNKTLSELGNFLVIFSRLHNKDIVYWERDELFELKDKKEEFYMEQSRLDTLTQDILHDIKQIKKEDITEEFCNNSVLKLREIQIERGKIKRQIKSLEKKERELINEKRKK